MQCFTFWHVWHHQQVNKNVFLLIFCQCWEKLIKHSPDPFLFSYFSLNLVANCTPSVPITHIAVDTPQRPRHPAAWNGILETCIVSSSSRDRGLYCIRQPVLSPPPSLRLASQLRRSIWSRSNSAFGPDLQCVTTTNENCNRTVCCLSPLGLLSWHYCHRNNYRTEIMLRKHAEKTKK